MGNCCEHDESTRNFHDWSVTEPSVAIINAIATIENTEPKNLATELDSLLYDHIDPTALNTLVTDGDIRTISFTFSGYRVKIDGNRLSIFYG